MTLGQLEDGKFNISSTHGEEVEDGIFNISSTHGEEVPGGLSPVSHVGEKAK